MISNGVGTFEHTVVDQIYARHHFGTGGDNHVKHTS